MLRPDNGNFGYVICTTARSGSTYLCQILSSTDRLGRPMEYLNPVGRRCHGVDDYPQNPQEQIAWMLRHRTTANGVYGLKLTPDHVDHSGGFDLTSHLPNVQYVYLIRRDLLGQAISLTKALKTNAWRASERPMPQLAFDRAQISTNLQRIAAAETRWRMFFAEQAIAPLWLTYEDVMAEPQKAVDAIAALLGIGEACIIDWERVTLEIQRDDQSHLWKRQFLAASADSPKRTPFPPAMKAAANSPALRLMRKIWNIPKRAS